MKRILLVGGAMLWLLTTHAQRTEWTLQFSNEQISFPFTSLGPIHPGLEIGYRLPVSEHREWQFNVGGFHHAELYTGIYLRAAHAFGWAPIEQVRLQVAPGIGYLHTIPQNALWKVGEDGVYRESGKMGQPHLMPEVGFQAILWPKARVSPMIGYRVALEAPFATVFPVMFHNFAQVGVSVSLSPNS